MIKKTALILMLLCVFCVNSHARVMDFFDRNDVDQYLYRNHCSAMFYDLRTTETGRIVFWNMKEVKKKPETSSFTYRLMILDLGTGEQVELMNDFELHKHQLAEACEISTDRQLRYIVLNVRGNVDERDPAKGCLSEIVVLDAQTQRPVKRIKDGRYHTEISMSDDGRYVAYYSHPVSYMLESNDEQIPMYRAEVFDLKTSTALTLSKECPKMLLTRDFVWSADSKTLLFFNHVQNGKAYDRTLFSWSPETRLLKQRSLRELGPDVFTLEVTPDNRVFLATPHEIHQMTTDLDHDRVLYKGKGILRFRVDGKKIRFNENHGKGGLGEPRVLDLD